MPMIEVNGADLYYEIEGDGPETLVFVHGLMLASESFDGQREALRDRYRLVFYDLRGQGRSAKTRERLDLDSLAEDLIQIIERLGGGRSHLLGFSMGTFIAMRVAARRPELVRTLTLIGPSADAEEPENRPRYAALIALVSILGPKPFAGALMKILFGDTFLAAPEKTAELQRWLTYVKGLPRALHRAAAASAGRASIAHELAAITAPTLILSGEEDRPISPDRARAVHGAVKGSRFLAFPRTGHAVMIEQPEAFNRALRDHLDSGGSAGVATDPVPPPT